MLTVIDEFTRRCMAVVVERRLNSDNVLHCLTELFVQHGPPDHIRSDNGSEFTAHAVRDWLGRIGVKTLYIEPGSPWENGYNESFNSKLRDEILNTEIFYTLKEAKVLIERWRHHYNTIRPHSSLGYRPPAPETILPNVEGPTYAVDGLRLAHQLNPRQTLTGDPTGMRLRMLWQAAKGSGYRVLENRSFKGPANEDRWFCTVEVQTAVDGDERPILSIWEKRNNDEFEFYMVEQCSLEAIDADMRTWIEMVALKAQPKASWGA